MPLFLFTINMSESRSHFQEGFSGYIYLGSVILVVQECCKLKCAALAKKMLPQGPSTPVAGAQKVSPALLRSNSGFMGGQGGGISSQNAFAYLVSPCNQINNMRMLMNVPNIPSLLHQPFGNGVPNSGLSGPGSSQRGLIDGGAESDPLTNVGNAFFQPFWQPDSNKLNNLIVGVFNKIQLMRQFSVPNNTQQHSQSQQPQQQFQAMRSGLAGVGSVKLEPQTTSEDHRHHICKLCGILALLSWNHSNYKV